MLSRAVIAALMPPGSLWVPEDDGGLDLLLDGIGSNYDRYVAWLSQLAYLRDPLLTPILSDLEREFGIIPDTTVDEAIRRARLQVAVYQRQSDATDDTLQDALTGAGFNVTVHVNDPPVDPGLFLNYAPSSIIGNAILGDSGLGARGGDILVNGIADYTVPVDAGYWPLFFFVGGEATRNGSGEITDIALANIPISRRGEFRRLILAYMPMGTWAGLMIRYTS